MHACTHRPVAADRRGGFTLVELMIGVALFSILLVLAIPALSEMIQNGRVRGASQSLAAALQLARSEAIRRNTDVRFALVRTEPSGIPGAAPEYCTSSGSDSHWAVWVETGGPSNAVARELIDSRAAHEGGSPATRVSCAAAPGAANPGEVVFDASGATRNTGTLRYDVTSGAGRCLPDGFVRCLAVAVTAGGAVRVCDPLVTDAGDARRCPR